MKYGTRYFTPVKQGWKNGDTVLPPCPRSSATGGTGSTPYYLVPARLMTELSKNPAKVPGRYQVVRGKRVDPVPPVAEERGYRVAPIAPGAW